MREGLVPADDALAIVLEGAGPDGAETVEIDNAHGRVLAADLASLRTQPPFAVSAMDGFAVVAADTAKPPVHLKIVGESAAGRSFSGTVGQGEAVRIFTGARVPEGADAVAIQENAAVDGENVEIRAAVTAGRNVRPAGLDFHAGDKLLGRGDLLSPAAVALAAAMNHARVPVFRKPRVGVIATGDELAPPGPNVGPEAIVASNNLALCAVAAEAGGHAYDFGIIGDTQAGLETAIQAAVTAEMDVIVTSGGASVGDYDLVKPALLALGARIEFEKIAVRPGKPFIFARLPGPHGEVRFLGLAGNPVSSLISALAFLRPLVGKLAGRKAEALARVAAIAGADLNQNDERQDYLRATLSRRADGRLVATPFERQDSSMLATLAKADCLLVRPPHAKAAKAGAAVEVILMREV
jgi:molybdopterin molybdotransferase